MTLSHRDDLIAVERKVGVAVTGGDLGFGRDRYGDAVVDPIDALISEAAS